jgi:hypothetical protein
VYYQVEERGPMDIGQQPEGIQKDVNDALGRGNLKSLFSEIIA